MNRVFLAIFLFSAAACMSQETVNFSDSAVLARLSRDVHVLCSDSLAGRKSGSAGEEKAYKYISRCFREAGLAPCAMNDSSFLQSFPIENLSIPFKSNSFTIEGLDIAPRLHFKFSPVAYSANGRMEGNKYIVVDLSGFRKKQQRKSNTIFKSLRQVIRDAFQQGNSAVILTNEWMLKSQKTDSLYNWADVKSEQGLVISVNDDISEYLQNHPGVNISIMVEVVRKSTIFHNVVGFINNGAPYTIIIGAHYDHLGTNSHGYVYNGADDNASGTVVAIELARYLKYCGEKTNNYLFIAFSGEEEGLYGSGYFVKHPMIGLETINFMINLDMVGRLGCEGNLVTIFGTGSSPAWHTVYKETAHPWFHLWRMQGVHLFTDHVGFYRQGIPVISLTTGFHYDYHTTHDDVSTLNYTGMVEIVKYLNGLLHTTSSKGKVGYHKIAGWYNFNANLKIVVKGIDHTLSVGSDE